MSDIKSSEFINILQKLVSEQGKEALLNPAKCKAFLADYTKGEYKKERRLLLQALEVGVIKAIDIADDLKICKKQQTNVLKEECFLAEEVATNIVDVLALVLRNVEIKKSTSIENNQSKSSNSKEKIISTTNFNSVQKPNYQPTPNKVNSSNIYTPYEYTNNTIKKKSSSGFWKPLIIVIVIVIIIISSAISEYNLYSLNSGSVSFTPQTTFQQSTQFARGDAVRVRNNARDVNAPNTNLQSWVYREVLYIGSIDYQGYAILYRNRNYTQQNLVGRFRTSDLIK